MKRILFFLFSIGSFISLSAQTHQPLTIKHLTGDFYVYTTWHTISSGPYPSNSMYVITTAGIVMIDTPWDTTQCKPLMDSLEHRYHKKVVLCIATHSHGDRTNGLNFLKALGVKTYTSKLTYDQCVLHKMPKAQYYFTKDTTFTVGNYTFEAYYPGPGHTVDNIVVWFAKEHVLYGGCFVKSTEVSDLGYLDDADVKAWPNSIHNVMKHCPGIKYDVPGHYGWDGDGLQHTLDMCNQANSGK